MTNKLIKCISWGNLQRIVLIIKQGCLRAWGYLFSNLWKRDSLYTSYSYLAAWLRICPNSSVNICNNIWKHSSEVWSISTWDHHAVTETLIRSVRSYWFHPNQSRPVRYQSLIAPDSGFLVLRVKCISIFQYGADSASSLFFLFWNTWKC